jgi:hypothetical protein
MIFRGSLRHSVTEAHSPTTVHAAVNEVKPSGPCSPATPRGMLQIVQDNRRLRAPTSSPKHRTALHRNSHLLNTHHYQLTKASYLVKQRISTSHLLNASSRFSLFFTFSGLAPRRNLFAMTTSKCRAVPRRPTMELTIDRLRPSPRTVANTSL